MIPVLKPRSVLDAVARRIRGLQFQLLIRFHELGWRLGPHVLDGPE